MTLFSISAVLALLLSGFVLTLKQQRAANFYFTAALAVLAALNALTATFGPVTPHTVGLVKTALSASLPALLFLHLKCLLKPDVSRMLRACFHGLAPLTALFVPEIGSAEIHLSRDATLFGIWSFYAILSVGLVMRAGGDKTNGRRSAILLWSRLICVWMVGVAVMDLLLALAAEDGLRSNTGTSFVAAGLLALATVAVLLFAGLHRLDTLGWLLDRTAHRVTRPDNLIDKLEADLRQSRAYLDPNLSLQKFARKLKLPQRVITDEINEARGRNFRSWLNGFRIQRAKQLLKGNDCRTVTDIFLEAGFQTKSTFNAAFKAETGLSPSAWRAQTD